MESLKNRMHISDFSLLTDGIAIGLLGGSASVFYRLMLSYVGKLRSFLMTSVKWERNVLWFFLIIGISFVVCRLLKWEPLSGGSGIPQISGEMLGRFSMNPFRVLISKIAGGALVNFSGFSLGREGPSIQIGAATGKLCAKWMRRGGREEKIMTSAGAGAGLAAAFSAPIAGTIFVFEELHKTFSRALIIPTFTASILAMFLANRVFGMEPEFRFTLNSVLPLSSYGILILLGIFLGLVGVCFNETLIFFKKLHRKLPFSPQIRLTVTFFIVGLTVFCVDVLAGGGDALIEHLYKNQYALPVIGFLLAAKLVLTCFCFGSGVQGGIFLPILVIGSASGVFFLKLTVAAGVLNDAMIPNFIIFGMAGILASVVRSPLLSVVLVTEMTGNLSATFPIALTVFVSYMVAELLKNKPVYESLLEMMSSSEGNRSEKHLYTSVRVSMLSDSAGYPLVRFDFPEDMRIVEIVRGGETIIPKGDTVLQAGDELMISTTESRLEEARQFFEKPKIR